MKQFTFPFISLFLIINSTELIAQSKTVSADTDWNSRQAIIKNSAEADYIIRLGDVDNLGFGWPGDFDPFCGRMTEAHPFPWEPQQAELPGFDRILLSSKYQPAKSQANCNDGYSESFDAVKAKPVSWTIPTDAIGGTIIKNIYLQLFIDDFQAPSLCSKFQLLINGKRFIEGEKFLNAVDQTGPVGKLISIPLTEDYYPLLNNSKSITVFIDEATGTGDGFAVDFIRLLVNRKLENTCKGNIRGRVFDKDTEVPIEGARVFTTDQTTVTTNRDGAFFFENLPAGLEVIGASATGYLDSTGTADIGPGDENPELIILLTKGKTTKFNNQPITTGASVTLNNILFDQGKADIKSESKPELDNLVTFLKDNPSAEIELSGHTSSEGDKAYNRSLSYKRVKACKDYIVAKGIAEDRIIAIGFGPDRPIASNDTEAGRSKNRRVEMRLIKL